jgi:hypothetical protein
MLSEANRTVAVVVTNSVRQVRAEILPAQHLAVVKHRRVVRGCNSIDLVGMRMVDRNRKSRKCPF